MIASALAPSLVAPASRAEPPLVQDVSSYSPYEQETMRIGLEKTGREIEAEPDGKTIEAVDIVTLEVFEKRDPIPDPLNPIVNFFHVTTKPYFVQRELLFKVGDPYRRRIVEESARNLRGLPQLTVVILVPVKGSAPDRVRMLLITKDLWSLRAPIEYRITSTGGIEYVQAQLTEINLFGTHHQAALNFGYLPDTVSFGGSFVAPRLWGSRFRLELEGNGIYNFKTGELEGTYGSFSYTQPLFSLATEWSYGATMDWSTGITRVYVGSRIGEFDPDDPSTPCPAPREAEDRAAPGPPIPCVYTRDYQSGDIFLTRSFGSEIKHNVTLSAEAVRRIYRPADLSQMDPDLAAEFVRRLLPVNDVRLGPSLQYRTFSARFIRMLDIERLGLQEEYQLGHNVVVKVSPAYAPLRDSKSVTRLFAGASYTLDMDGSLLRAYIESTTDLQPDGLPDGSIDVGARVVGKRTVIGRLVLDGRLLHRYANSLNNFSSLGGNTRLRGYPTGAFRGSDMVAMNAELRSRPFEVLKAQIAASLFYDTGDAFDGFGDVQMKQSAGFGLRVFLPQINRIVIRGDWGFPLTPGYRYGDVSASTGQVIGGFPGELTITFGQAFPMPVVPVSDATTQ